jgi:hypothetical protein
MNIETEKRFALARRQSDPWKRAALFKEAKSLLETEPVEVPSVPDASAAASCKKFNCGPSFLRRYVSWLAKPSKIPRPVPYRDVRVNVGQARSSQARMGHGRVQVEEPAPPTSAFIARGPMLDLEGKTPENELMRLLKAIPEATAKLVQRGKKSIEDRILALRDALFRC